MFCVRLLLHHLGQGLNPLRSNTVVVESLEAESFHRTRKVCATGMRTEAWLSPTPNNRFDSIFVCPNLVHL